MGYPRAIVSVRRLAQFIGLHTSHRFFVGLWIVLNRNLRGHAPDGMDIATVTGLDGEQGVRAHEMRCHSHLGAIGQDETGDVAELFDRAEDIVPASAVQTG